MEMGLFDVRTCSKVSRLNLTASPPPSDGLISFPIGLAAYFLAPDLPNKAKPNWKFSQADLDLANARRPREANDDPEKLTKKKVLGYFKTWHIYLFSLLFICTGSASNPSSSMGFWFKFSTYVTYRLLEVKLISISP
jgi:hypothetical protein